MNVSADNPCHDKSSTLRQLAEGILDHPPPESEVLTKEEINRLIHELRVHQIELEMQNDELRRSRLALEQSHDKYALLFEHAPAGYLILDDKGKILEVNLVGAQMLGVDRCDLPGQSLTRFLHKDDQDLFFRHRREVFSSPNRQTCRLRLCIPSREILSTRLESRALPDENPRRCLTLFTDITLQEKMEAALHQSQKLEALGTLAGGVAHEFNNDLAIILGHSELARLMLPRESPIVNKFQIIFNTVMRSKKVVRQLLEFSHQQTKEEKPFPLLSLVKETIDLLRVALPILVEIHVADDGEKEHILGEPNRVQQVIINLCTNAAQSLPPSGGRIDIRLENIQLATALPMAQGILEAGRFIRLTVEDNGGGIHPDHMSRLFDPFFTTKEVGQGTGMGLAVVYSIVHDMGGGIALESTLGKGTAFHIYFPVWLESEETPVFDFSFKPGKGQRILVVDDEPDIVELTKELLEHNGFHVTVCRNPLDALHIIQTAPDSLDLLITDLAMPKLSGEALIAQTFACQPGLPILICTGFGDALNQKGKFPSSVRGFLTKPITRDELMAAIDQALYPPSPQ